MDGEPNNLAEAAPLSSEAKVALAKDAFRRFYAKCFWYMREDFVVTTSTLPLVIHGLRQNGNRETYAIVDRLCR